MENLTNQTQQNNTLPVVLRTRSSVDTGPDTEFEKSINRTQPPQEPDATQTRDIPETGAQDQPSNPYVNKMNTKQKWTKEEYIEVMHAYYHTTLNQEKTTSQKETYTIWRQRNPNTRPNMDSNKLGAVRRDIIKHKRITDNELNKIIKSVKDELKISHPHLYTEPAVPDEQNIINPPETLDPPQPEIQTQAHNIDANQETNVSNDLANQILDQYLIQTHIPIHERDSLPKINNNNKNKKIIKEANQAINKLIPQLIEDSGNNLETINTLTYSAAHIVTEKCGIKVKKRTSTPNIHKKPAWIERINRQMNQLRADISFLVEASKGKTNKTKKRKNIIAKHNLYKKTIEAQIETLKQRIQLKAKRLARYKKRSAFYRQNKLFQENTKKFYRELGKNTITVDDPPSQQQTEEFWKNIWSNPKEFNSDAEWIKDQEEANANINQQEWQDITLEELQTALAKSQKWKSPGLDMIPNFWLNSFTNTHDALVNAYSDIMNNPENAPQWFSQGITYLLAKTEETNNPKNYRPITCLTTMYKLLTSIITNRMYEFLDINNIFPDEQKGCKRGSYGCKDQLLIDKMILENCKNNRRNLSTAWIDYKKAFDSVPHEWIIKALEMYKVSPTIVKFLKESMNAWSTTLVLNHSQGTNTFPDIDIACGIFQGDSLSPLLFCLALFPLSTQLNNAQRGYKVHDQTISHLIYMDDLKLFAKNDSDLEDLLKIVKDFSSDIGMEFGLDKCAKATFKAGKFIEADNIDLDITTVIRNLDQADVYKYLGVNEGDGIQHSKMKEKIRKECYRRVRLILESELNASNRVNAINSLAIPVVTYGFGIIKWSITDIRRIDGKIRKLLTSFRMHHPKSDVDRIYLPRKIGGRGLIQLEQSFKTSLVGLEEYLKTTDDAYLKAVLVHENSKDVSFTKLSQEYKQTLGIQTIAADQVKPTAAAKQIKEKVKNAHMKSLEENWKSKPLHGKYPERLSKADIDPNLTHQWLRGTGLKAETEGFIIAAQDQSLPTRNYKANIVKDGSDPSCRVCGKFPETVDHIVAGCPILADKEYLIRQDRLGYYIHWKACQHYKIKVPDQWYKHQPADVVNGENVTILWNFDIQTDKTIKAVRPDIVIKDYATRTCLLIDMTCPQDANVSKKEFQKLSNYTDLRIEVTKMWSLDTTVVPVVIGALGTIKKGTEKYVEKLPGQPSLSELQKITLMGTSHILRKALSI